MSISEILNNILKAIHGKDVRQSLYEGIKLATDIASEVKEAMAKLNDKFEAQIKNMTLESPSDAEIVAARMDASGKAYDTLGKRLDAGDANVNEVQTILMSGVARVTTFAGTFNKGHKQGTVDIQKSKSVEIGGKTYKFVPIGVVGSKATSGIVGSGTCTIQGTFVTYEEETDQAYVVVHLNEEPEMDVEVDLDVLYVLSSQDMSQLLI